jgi:hypothetical protein
MGVRFPQETYYFIDASTFPAFGCKANAKNLLSPAEEEIFLFDFLFTLNTIRISAIYFWTFAD